ncbi:TetR/AcrR family transcriptional regulator [Amphibacillus jilinensis]|uniref:TetR/AcrR family transcriptional regulator n=1 Tax=Amphibacillus jilinensis TaxID=1216008 RepID=UPI0002DA4499|nr:TetR/AcrR family transcriptional regulator [Amphibacillus jilinensis]
MAVARKVVSKERIVKTLLDKVEENEGIKEVNLRGIAKEMGCAHTNIYNYFSSFTELIWVGISQVLLTMIQTVEVRIASEHKDQDRLFAALDEIVCFSLDHPGWYRLIWLEAVDGEPPEDISSILTQPSIGLATLLAQAADEQLTDEDITRITHVLHSYMHGEICQWLSGRAVKMNKQELRAAILFNLKHMYRLLTQELE